jgi:hypothetical protein
VPNTGDRASTDKAALVRPIRTLTMAVQHEPPGLLPKSLSSTGRLENVIRLFNASLAYAVGDGSMQPYLAAALPQLNSDTWQIFSDGKPHMR